MNPSFLRNNWLCKLMGISMMVTVFYALLLNVVLLPMATQEFIISSVQPVLYAGICVVVYSCIKNPILFLAAISVFLTISACAYYYVKHVSKKQLELTGNYDSSKVVPDDSEIVSSVSKDEIRPSVPVEPITKVKEMSAAVLPKVEKIAQPVKRSHYVDVAISSDSSYSSVSYKANSDSSSKPNGKSSNQLNIHEKNAGPVQLVEEVSSDKWPTGSSLASKASFDENIEVGSVQSGKIVAHSLDSDVSFDSRVS